MQAAKAWRQYAGLNLSSRDHKRRLKMTMDQCKQWMAGVLMQLEKRIAMLNESFERSASVRALEHQLGGVQIRICGAGSTAVDLHTLVRLHNRAREARRLEEYQQSARNAVRRAGKASAPAAAAPGAWGGGFGAPAAEAAPKPKVSQEPEHVKASRSTRRRAGPQMVVENPLDYILDDPLGDEELEAVLRYVQTARGENTWHIVRRVKQLSGPGINDFLGAGSRSFELNRKMPFELNRKMPSAQRPAGLSDPDLVMHCFVQFMNEKGGYQHFELERRAIDVHVPATKRAGRTVVDPNPTLLNAYREERSFQQYHFLTSPSRPLTLLERTPDSRGSLYLWQTQLRHHQDERVSVFKVVVIDEETLRVRILEPTASGQEEMNVFYAIALFVAYVQDEAGVLDMHAQHSIGFDNFDRLGSILSPCPKFAPKFRVGLGRWG